MIDSLRLSSRPRISRRLRSPFAQLLQAIDGVEIVVVCNRSEESSQRVATEFGIARIASKWYGSPPLTALACSHVMMATGGTHTDLSSCLLALTSAL